MKEQPGSVPFPLCFYVFTVINHSHENKQDMSKRQNKEKTVKNQLKSPLWCSGPGLYLVAEGTRRWPKPSKRRGPRTSWVCVPCPPMVLGTPSRWERRTGRTPCEEAPLIRRQEGTRTTSLAHTLHTLVHSPDWGAASSEKQCSLPHTIHPTPAVRFTPSLAASHHWLSSYGLNFTTGLLGSLKAEMSCPFNQYLEI